ncbi:MAG: type II toxin-antitoxin system Phd/YefM family antitoxin [Blastocatellia bacterium]
MATIKINLKEFRDQLPDLLDQIVRDDDVCVIERDGEPYAVIVGFREWSRQTTRKLISVVGEPSRHRRNPGQSRAKDENAE